ncbi:MAG: DUF917 domain-containing protein [Rhodospirillaceae bacterium]|jgi:hypothetical protein|nr:DUF917 domain-containing protein [Rhodospirillaceae bacterium]MBT5082886.1 DUF917 domain-containing protein [Rhodospirillaceae bacterium]MBT5524330.1 DUF917 domain-containing protein [Rhodospirillaceae bacterium]MBT5878874.1 DUF917 domain-containing protein [Rhodospirillaceae bacterium]MBT6912143.1 DUF917 domain-containing protein [Rhodospirillaceae bacterium]
MIKIGLEDLDDIALGATFLGTGGGGDPYIATLMTRRAMIENGPVTLLSLDELEDDALVVSCGNLGAPTVAIEKIMGADQPAAAVLALEKHLGRSIDALLAFEAGGSNSMMPIYIAAMLGKPVIDADGMGRAFPELQMVTFSVYGVSSAPFALASEHGDTTILDIDDDTRAEYIARGIAIRMGARAAMASYPMDGRTARRVAIPGTTSLCQAIGANLRESRAENREPFAALVEMLAGTHYGHAKVLYQGKVMDLTRETRQGWAIGKVSIVDEEAAGLPLTIEFQNEFLVARQGDVLRAMVPDLVCILDTEMAQPITTERLRYGQRVTVMAVSAPAIMRTEAALAAFGPAAFGLADAFVPVEDLD